MKNGDKILHSVLLVFGINDDDYGPMKGMIPVQ